jgi:omega-amidase
VVSSVSTTVRIQHFQKKGDLTCLHLLNPSNNLLYNRNVIKIMSSSTNVQTQSFKLAMCQLSTCSDKNTNIQNAINMLRESAEKGAQLAILPECFNSPYGNKYFPVYAEELESSITLQKISEITKQLGIYTIAGSIPTRDFKTGKLYNTCVVLDREGKRIAIYNKVHLFDVNVPNKIVFQESATLTPGDKLTTFDMNIGSNRVVKVGIGICFDVRFPEIAQIYQRQGCELLVYPGAFNMTTGPAHWELLCRARALDNQLFVCMVSPARDITADYVAYGHSMVCSPWGEKIVEADEKQCLLLTDVNLDYAKEIREQIPAIKNKRIDLYDVVYKK